MPQYTIAFNDFGKNTSKTIEADSHRTQNREGLGHGAWEVFVKNGKPVFEVRDFNILSIETKEG